MRKIIGASTFCCTGCFDDIFLQSVAPLGFYFAVSPELGVEEFLKLNKVLKLTVYHESAGQTTIIFNILTCL